MMAKQTVSLIENTSRDIQKERGWLKSKWGIKKSRQGDKWRNRKLIINYSQAIWSKRSWIHTLTI